MAKNKVDIFEVGPRDGLQNEKAEVTYDLRREFIQRLAAAGVADMEIGAFVNPKRVPQMADTVRLYEDLKAKRLDVKGARVWSLVPNVHGLDDALKAGADRIAVFTAASETFVKKNIGMTIAESLAEFKTVVAAAHKKGLRVRGYISTAFACPYEGKIAPKQALKVIDQLAALGVTQVSIGDTIGVGTPADVKAVVGPALKTWGPKRVAVHFHDTRGTALANSLRAYDLGVRVFDSSAGGLGGCPFAPGAKGNLATEDLVYMFEGMGVKTGIDLDALSETSIWMAEKLNRAITSRYVLAYASQQGRKSTKPTQVHF